MRILIEGCDDTTEITEGDWGGFSKDELKTLRKLSRLSKKCSFGYCQPVIEIENKEYERLKDL